jgi:hypothetical protein
MIFAVKAKKHLKGMTFYQPFGVSFVSGMNIKAADVLMPASGALPVYARHILRRKFFHTGNAFLLH